MYTDLFITVAIIIYYGILQITCLLITIPTEFMIKRGLFRACSTRQNTIKIVTTILFIRLFKREYNMNIVKGKRKNQEIHIIWGVKFSTHLLDKMLFFYRKKNTNAMKISRNEMPN